MVLKLTSNVLAHFFEGIYIIVGGDGNGTPLQYSCLENPLDGGAWKAAVHGVVEGRTRLSDFTFTFHFHASRRKWQPTPVFSPGESQGQRSLVGCHLWSRTESDTTKATSLSLFTFMHWRRKWQPTPVFLPGESQGRSLVGCRLWGCTVGHD